VQAAASRTPNLPVFTGRRTIMPSAQVLIGRAGGGSVEMTGAPLACACANGL